MSNYLKLAVLGSASTEGEDGWRDDTYFYIRPHIWTRIHGDKGGVVAARHLFSLGFLMRNKDGNQHRMPRSVLGQPKVYAVHRRILDEPSGPVVTTESVDAPEQGRQDLT